jgi:hypothetical protein
MRNTPVHYDIFPLRLPDRTEKQSAVELSRIPTWTGKKQSYDMFKFKFINLTNTGPLSRTQTYVPVNTCAQGCGS